MQSLHSAQRRLTRLELVVGSEQRVKPARELTDAELEMRLTDGLVQMVGTPLGLFKTFEALETVLTAVPFPADSVVRQLWEKARWLVRHADHGPFRYGPRWSYRPLLSCACGGHLTVYREMVPKDWWSRIVQDDEPRTEPYYPMYPDLAGQEPV